MTWIMTRHGRRFDYARPTAEMVFLPDIVHALANNCRFNGHVKSFFSVAQHSAEGAIFAYQTYPLEIRDDVARAFLHHDFHEAYLSDFPTPLKMVMGDDVLKPIEAAVDAAIFERFDIAKLMATYKKDVKEIDTIMLWSDAIRWRTDGWTTIDGVETPTDRVWVPEDFEVPDGLPETAMAPWQAREYLEHALRQLGGYTQEQIFLGV